MNDHTDDLHNVLLLGLDLGRYDADRSMDELAALAERKRHAPGCHGAAKAPGAGPRHRPCSGRLAEARALAENETARTAIYDGELSGSQLRNMEKALGMPVIDRTLLILEIFASRASRGR